LRKSQNEISALERQQFHFQRLRGRLQRAEDELPPGRIVRIRHSRWRPDDRPQVTGKCPCPFRKLYPDARLGTRSCGRAASRLRSCGPHSDARPPDSVGGVRGLELANVVSKRFRLHRRPNRLAFQNILGPEIFRGKAANNLTCRSGAKTVQFEIGCPLGR
jgi:hypothetical protein